MASSAASAASSVGAETVASMLIECLTSGPVSTRSELIVNDLDGR